MADAQSLLREFDFGSIVPDYLTAIGLFVALALALWVGKRVALSQLRRLAGRTDNLVDDFIVGLVQRQIGPLVYLLIALYISVRSLELPASLADVLHIVFVIVLVVKGVRVANALISFLLTRWGAREDSPTRAAAVKNMKAIIGVALWVGALLFILDNLGINVTAAVAGLGIGGVAIAIAAQAVLGDVFSSFAIYLDRPFEAGDFIIVGDLLGTVEHVGLKTTRIRSLGGEQLVFSNSDLTSTRIKNYKRMQERRVAFSLGVVYQTRPDRVREIPALIETMIRATEHTRFDRAHFMKYGDFALVFEVVYYVLSADYNLYMDVQQSINMQIMEAFAERGIEFAYPTQQVYVSGTPSGPALEAMRRS